ncbi:hypothetical protein ABKV19_027522 [Rosa sericea]
MNKLNWNIFFIFCCWFIWKWRCKSVFDVEFWVPYNPSEVILNYGTEWVKATAKTNTQVARSVEMLHWLRPAAGYHKLNVDGSRVSNGTIGAGGVIRDDTGAWCGGFMINVGAGEVLQAESWGLFHGLQLALSLQITKLEVESDSSVLIKLIQRENVDLHPLGTLIMNCRHLMQEFEFI